MTNIKPQSQWRELKKFFTKSLCFVLPFAALSLVLYAIDPFGYFGNYRLVNREIKQETSGRLHYQLWKSIQFLENPRSNILLGDSRAGIFSSDEIENACGLRYFNFSYGGGTIPEMVDTFWWLSERTRLERVDMTVGFLNYNAFQNMNRFRESSAMLDNPLLYLTNRIVWQAAYLNMAALYSRKTESIERPSANREEFWKQQLGPNIKALYGSYSFPESYLGDLQKISCYCRSNRIQFRFIIPPTHVEYQAKVQEYGLTEAYDRFLREIKTLGTVLDFDFPNAYTGNRENFSDPVHPLNDVPLLNAIWSDEQSEIVRITTN